MKSRISWVLIAPLLLGAVSSTVHAQSAAPINYTQVTRPVVAITEPELMDFILFELFIEPLEQPTVLHVIDVTRNGYGPDDVIVIYPSVEAFLIPELLPDSVQAVMSQWAPEVEFRLDSGNLPADALAALIASDTDTTKRAEHAILYDVVRAVERNYRDLPVGMLFERDSVGFTFQIWDYNRTAMQYVPRPAFSADSAVAEVLTSLREIGYVPGQSGAVLGRNRGARSTNRVVSVDQALLRIQSIDDEQARHLAAKTLLLGAYDLDRSGVIDVAREIDAVSCEAWMALNTTFPDVISRFGFIGSSGPYLGNLFFNIAERLRDAAGRRGEACIAGRVPTPTPAETVALQPAREQLRLPRAVTEYFWMEAAAKVIDLTAPLEAHSADWADVVKGVLLEYFDSDSSGMLDQVREVNAVPCRVWKSLTSSHLDFVVDLGFSGATEYLGDRMGVDVQQQDFARSRIDACNATSEEIVPLRVRVEASPIVAVAGTERRPPRYSPEAALAAIRPFPVDERIRAARTILLSLYDLDGSGYVDMANEMDAIPCAFWISLDIALPGFDEEYGFVDDTSGAVVHFQGSIIFNISERLKTPAGRRVSACMSGLPPPPTRAEDLVASMELIHVATSLHQFLDTQTAAKLVRTTARLEPGSATWAAMVRVSLVEAYDLDNSDGLDSPEEVDEVPCVVWNTIRATFGADILVGLGFDGNIRYLGNLIGVDMGQMDRVAGRLRACGQ